MVKYIALWSVKPGLDTEETWKLWPKHAEWAKSVLKPELKRYVQNRIVEKLPGNEVDFFGVTEFWFDDMESAQRAFERLKNTPLDEFMVERAAPEKVRRVFVEEIEVEL